MRSLPAGIQVIANYVYETSDDSPSLRTHVGT